jgi:hypothetical protein
VSVTSGCRRRKRANAAGTKVESAVGKLPNRRRPWRRPAISASSLLGAVEPGEDAGRVPAEGVAGLGQLDRAHTALHERQSDLALEGRDVLAHGRLRQGEGLRRRGERALRDDLRQHPEAADVQHQCRL